VGVPVATDVIFEHQVRDVAAPARPSSFHRTARSMPDHRNERTSAFVINNILEVHIDRF
jgi:hypothetical protein